MHPRSYLSSLALLCVLGCSSVRIDRGHCGDTGSGSGSDAGSGNSGSGSDAGSGSGSGSGSATGQVQILWTIAIGGHPVTCATAGAVSVQLRLHPASGSDLLFGYPCADGHALSSPVPVGPYDAMLSLISADGALFGTLPAQHLSVDAAQGAQGAPFAFDLSTGFGHVDLSLAALGTVSHCAAQPDGAGITAQVLTLRDAEGVCIPVTFQRIRAGVPNGTYTVNCATPVAGPCIEQDETLSVDALPSGPYTISVTGLTGDAHQICWFGHDVLQVPASSYAKTVQLSRVGGQGC